MSIAPAAPRADAAPSPAPLGGLDALRHLLALGVIVQHSWLPGFYPAPMAPGYRLLVDGVDGAVFGFFLLAGFFLKPPAAPLAFLRRQTFRLLGPFVLFSLIYGLCGIALGQGDAQLFLTRLVTLQGSSMQLYFLPELLLIEAALVALFRLGLRPQLPQLLALLGLLVLLSLALPAPSSTGAEPRLLPFYALGFVAGMGLARGSRALPRALAAGALALGLFVDPRFCDVALVLVLFSAARALSPWLPARLPGSGGVFLLHTPLTNFALALALAALGLGGWPHLALTVAGSYLVSLALTRLWLRHLPRARWLLLE